MNSSTATLTWLSAAVTKVSDRLAGRGVPRRTIGVATPPKVSSRMLRGKNSNVRLDISYHWRRARLYLTAPQIMRLHILRRRKGRSTPAPGTQSAAAHLLPTFSLNHIFPMR